MNTQISPRFKIFYTIFIDEIIPTNRDDVMIKPIITLIFVLILFPMFVNAQTIWMEESWPSYEKLYKMDCYELALQWTLIRGDMTTLMKPENLEKNKLWKRANINYRYINAFQSEKNCNSYNPRQLKIPLPQEYYSFSDAQLVECSKKCLKDFVRVTEAIQILRIGANANYVECQTNLGVLIYYTGDRHNGKKWLRSAIYLGSSDAKKILESIEKTESNQ